MLTPDFPDEHHRYIGSSFVKNQLEPLKPFFKKIVVICPVPFCFGLNPSDRYCSDYQYDNVNVYFPRCFFLPRNWRIPFLTNRQKMRFDSRYHAIRQLIRKKNIRFDLIHAHFTWPSAYIAVRLKEEFHVPVIATIHEDSAWLDEEIHMDQPLLVRTWRNCDVLIRVNKQEIPVLSQSNNRTIFVPNGFGPEFHPMDKQECRRFLNLPAHSKIVFGLAPLIERKGFSYLIGAMKQVIKKDPSVICYIGGSGPEKNSLMNQIQQKGLEKYVFLPGFLAEDQIVRWMNSADVFVLPSLQESFGIVQIEALACGTPVVAARNAGSGEVIISEDLGILCDPGNAESLAGAILRGLERSWDTAKILEYAQRYRWDFIAEDLLRVYETVLKRDPPTRDT